MDLLNLLTIDAFWDLDYENRLYEYKRKSEELRKLREEFYNQYPDFPIKTMFMNIIAHPQKLTIQPIDIPMSNSKVIVGYQPNNCCFLFKQLPDDKGVWRGMISKDFDAFQTMRMPVAKWTIRPKNNLQPLATPILSEEDVKCFDFND